MFSIFKIKKVRKSEKEAVERHYAHDCLFCSKVGYCYKKHREAYLFDCNHCKDFYQRTKC